MKIKEVKRQAREAMSGKWSKFVGMNLLLILVSLIAVIIVLLPIIFQATTLSYSVMSEQLTNAEFNNISMNIAISVMGSYLLLIVMYIFIVPLSYSFIENIVNLKRDSETKATAFLRRIFKNFGRSWKVALWSLVKILIIYLIFIAISIAYVVITAILSLLKSSILLVILSIVFLIIAFIFEIMFIARILSLVLAQYIAIDNQDMTAKDCVDKSVSLMKGYRWKYIFLNISFIGWMILSLFTLGIGYLFLTPYMNVSYVCFYENILKEKNESNVEVIETT